MLPSWSPWYEPQHISSFLSCAVGLQPRGRSINARQNPRERTSQGTNKEMDLLLAGTAEVPAHHVTARSPQSWQDYMVITHSCESLVALPELLTLHLEKIITSGDQGTEEVVGTFRPFWLSSQ